MSENITHPRHWTSLKLDPFEDIILNEFVRGSSLRSIRDRLGKHKCTASISTISAFIQSRPGARIRTSHEQSQVQSTGAA